MGGQYPLIHSPELLTGIQKLAEGQGDLVTVAKKILVSHAEAVAEDAKTSSAPRSPVLLEVTPELETVFRQFWMRFQQTWNARDWAQMAALYVNVQVTPPAPVKQSNGREVSWADFMAVVKRNRENEGEITSAKLGQIELQENQAEVEVDFTFSKSPADTWGRAFVKTKDGRWLLKAR